MKATPTRWVDGRLVDERPAPGGAWARVLGVLALLLLVDLSLARLPASSVVGEPGPAAPGPRSAAQLRATIAGAVDAADAGRSLLLIGDSVLAGDVLMAARPEDWPRHRVVENMARELGSRDGLAGAVPASLHQIALDGLLPVDALHLVGELDRLDPEGEVELVLEINLRYFSKQYADQRECTRPEICELAPEALRPSKWTMIRAGLGLAELAWVSRDALLRWAPVLRRRAHFDGRSLDGLDGLVVARSLVAEPPTDRTEAEARMAEHYRSAAILQSNEQRRALADLLDRLAAKGRPATLFSTPLRDDFAEVAVGADLLGKRYSALARLVNDLGVDHVQLVDLDHPLFVAAHFIDHVHLQPEGARLLAINLIHELGLPLRHRPFEAMMVHPEGHDRSLVHRVDRGYAEGGAWMAQLDHPSGAAVDRGGSRLIVADTNNHVLRELRANMQFVETLAGQPDAPGWRDGEARGDARLDHPRYPELLEDAIWFIDGEDSERLRVVEHGWVRTPSWAGPRCERYARLRPEARPEARAVWMLCGDGRLLRLGLDEDGAPTQARTLSEPEASPAQVFELGPEAVYFADAQGRLWQRPLLGAGAIAGPSLGDSELIIDATGPDLIPNGYGVAYPYAYADLHLNQVLDLRYVERYGGLLVADEFPLHTKYKGLYRRVTERVHLRYFDLEAERVLPWIAPLVHGDGHLMYNERVDQLVSYWHLGSMALAQDDASLFWVEQQRSRILRVADGLLGVAKTGNHHTRGVTVPILMTIAGVSRKVEVQMRPDRFLDRRHEPIPRRGPYVAALFGSSLSSMSDRVSNYSLGRRLELELQRELGYRDGLRLDLFAQSTPASSFGQNVNNFANWMQTSVPPDVVFIEVHDFGASYLRTTKEARDVHAAFARLQRLAALYDTMVVFYDVSSLEANRRDGMRATDRRIRELLDMAARLGFVVLDPGDRLLPQLLMHSPWGNQPFGENQHHGATWAIDMTAQTLAASVAPKLRAHLRDRVPARLRERATARLGRAGASPTLRRAFDGVELDPRDLPELRPGHLQTRYVDRRLHVYVDLAGFVDAEGLALDRLALAVIAEVLQDELYLELADALELELMRFSSYDEYGAGVLDSAEVVWSRSFGAKSLRRFVAAASGGD